MFDLPFSQAEFFVNKYATLFLLFLVCSSLLLCGCSSGGITRQAVDEAATANVRIAKPSHIYISEVSVTSGAWTPVSDKPEFHAKAKKCLQKYLLEELADVAPTSNAAGGETSGLLVTVATSEVDVNNIGARVLWGVQCYPPKLVVRVRILDLAQSATAPVAAFAVQGNYWTYNPAIAGGRLDDDYLDKMSESIAQQTAEELHRLLK
jgi:hypothetical protein